MAITTLEEAEVTPGKHADTRIKSRWLLPMATAVALPVPLHPNGHLRPLGVKYTAVKFLAVSLLENGGFRIETAIWIQKWFLKSVRASRKL
jgi:hypothetical protein